MQRVKGEDISIPVVDDQPAQVPYLPRPYTRQLICVSFIILASVWSLYSGVKNRYFEESPLTFKLRENLPKSEVMASAAARAPFILKETKKAAGLVIFLHGLGDTGIGWFQAFDGFKRDNIRYVFPNADAIPVTLNMGMVMPSWFDIKSLDMSGSEDEPGIKSSSEKLKLLIKEHQEQTGVPTNKIMLGGFSMGGSLALYTGLTYPEQLGGLVLLSSWLPLRQKFQTFECKQMCPIFQAHGTADTMVPEKFGNMTHTAVKMLRGDSAQTIYKTYKGVSHSSSDTEMDDVRDFIKEHLPDA